MLASARAPTFPRGLGSAVWRPDRTGLSAGAAGRATRWRRTVARPGPAPAAPYGLPPVWLPDHDVRAAVAEMRETGLAVEYEELPHDIPYEEFRWQPAVKCRQTDSEKVRTGLLQRGL